MLDSRMTRRTQGYQVRQDVRALPIPDEEAKRLYVVDAYAAVSAGLTGVAITLARLPGLRVPVRPALLFGSSALPIRICRAGHLLSVGRIGAQLAAIGSIERLHFVTHNSDCLATIGADKRNPFAPICIQLAAFVGASILDATRKRRSGFSALLASPSHLGVFRTRVRRPLLSRPKPGAADTGAKSPRSAWPRFEKLMALLASTLFQAFDLRARPATRRTKAIGPCALALKVLPTFLADVLCCFHRHESVYNGAPFL